MAAPVYRKSLVDKYLQRYYRAHMSSRVRVLRGVLGAGEELVYEGDARVHRMAAPVQMGFGDEPQYMVSGTVSVPFHDASGAVVQPQVNDMVVVLSHHDRKLEGRSFRVMHVDAGGEFEEMVQMSVMGSEESPTAPDIPRPPRWPGG